jgi:hypothetical protein
MGALQDEMQQVPPEQTSVEQVTPEQIAHTTDKLLPNAFGTSSEEEGHEEEGVRRMKVSSSQPTIGSLLFLSCTLFSIIRLSFV